MYFRKPIDAQQLVQYMMSAQTERSVDDMTILGNYRQDFPSRILPLPIVNSHRYPEPLSCNVSYLLDEFNSVFDAAAYGQVSSFLPFPPSLIRSLSYFFFLTSCSTSEALILEISVGILEGLSIQMHVIGRTKCSSNGGKRKMDYIFLLLTAFE